jgi:hypothetical protein
MGVDQRADHYCASDVLGANIVRAETSDLLAVLDALDRAMTDLIFGLRAETLLPDQQVRLGQLFEAIGLLLQHHAELVMLDIAKHRAARQQAQPPAGRATPVL